MMDINDILIKPVITEKSSLLREGGFYTFIISPSANKVEVKKAVEKLFEVEVVSCNTKIRKPKLKMLRTKKGYGKSKHLKYAIVKLKDGQKIKDLEA